MTFHSSVFRLLPGLAAGIALLAFRGWAAADPPSRVARLGYTRGEVSFSPAGEDDWSEASTNRPLTTGDRLWSDKGARAELQVGGATVRMSEHSSLSILNLDDQNAQIPGEALPPETGLTSVRIIRGPCYPQAQGGSFMTLRLQYSTAQIEHVQLKALDLPRRPEGSLRLGGMGWSVSHLTTPLVMGFLADRYGIVVGFYVLGAVALVGAFAIVFLRRWAFKTRPRNRPEIRQP